MLTEIKPNKEMTDVLIVALCLSLVWEGTQAVANTDDCHFGDQIYKVGDRWHPKVHPVQAEECVNCTCLKGGKVDCVATDCPKPDCDDPKYVHGKCCPVCEDRTNIPPSVSEELHGSDATKVPGCDFFDTHYEDGARFPSNRTSYTPKYSNQCVLCDCFRGEITCHVKTCLTDPNCIRTAKVRDDCCPICEEFVPDSEKTSESFDVDANLVKFGDCFTSSGRKENGTKWKPEVEHYGVMECVVCQCMNGHMSCSRVRCPVESALKCKRPQRRRGSCCRECHAGRRRKGRKNGKKKENKINKKGEKNGGKKGGKKSKRSGRKCKKEEDGKGRKKKGRRRRCKSKGKSSSGSKRKGKSRKRNGNSKNIGLSANKIEDTNTTLPLDTAVSRVIKTLCLPKRTERLVYLTKTVDTYSLSMDDIAGNSMERIRWQFKKGRIELTDRTMVPDPDLFRNQIDIQNIVGATTKRHLKKFMRKLDRKQKKCKKKCRRRMLDRLFKKLRTKKLDLNRKCGV